MADGEPSDSRVPPVQPGLNGPPGDPQSSPGGPLSEKVPPGPRVNRGHPFYIGFVGGSGALIAYWLLGLVLQLSSVLTLIVVALFLSLGLDPAVAALQRRGLRRGVALSIVVAGVVCVFIGFIAAVVPPLASQATELTNELPDLVQQLRRSSALQSLDHRYGVLDKLNTELQHRLSNGETVIQLFGGVFGAGRAVISGAFSTFTVVVLTLYFTASLRPMTEALYRLVPASRRPRVQVIGDEIIRRIGGYIAGQVIVATINGVCTFVLMSALGLPYPLLVALTVAVFGLIPLVGATLGAIVVVAVALFHSWQYALIAVVYYIVYQQVENYLIAPRIMARTVAVPGFVAVIAALAGGTLLGAVGALIAIPVAAGILLVFQEVVLPRQQTT